MALNPLLIGAGAMCKVKFARKKFPPCGFKLHFIGSNATCKARRSWKRFPDYSLKDAKLLTTYKKEIEIPHKRIFVAEVAKLQELLKKKEIDNLMPKRYNK